MIAAAPKAGAVLDLAAIAAALSALAALDPSAGAGDEPFDAETARRMAEGYAHVDALLAAGRDPLALGGAQDLLELNHLVLCGTSPARRAAYAAHIAATETRFYEDRIAGAAALYDWLSRQSRRPADAFAARLWTRMISCPQPFIEGNQRTATLAASFALAQAGLSPLVATQATAMRFARLGARCRAIDRTAWRAWIDLVLAARAVRTLVRAASSDEFLIHARPGTGLPP